jgi:hypothetical protein
MKVVNTCIHFIYIYYNKNKLFINSIMKSKEKKITEVNNNTIRYANNTNKVIK